MNSPLIADLIENTSTYDLEQEINDTIQTRTEMGYRLRDVQYQAVPMQVGYIEPVAYSALLIWEDATP